MNEQRLLEWVKRCQPFLVHALCSIPDNLPEYVEARSLLDEINPVVFPLPQPKQPWFHIECKFTWGWERSGSFPNSYPTRAEALAVIADYAVKAGGMTYRVRRSK